MSEGRGRGRTIWITWEAHPRTRNIAKRMGVELFEFTSSRQRLIKHPMFALKSLATLVKVRPSVLIVQNPSMVLTFLAIAVSPVLGYRLVVDAHNAGVYPCEAGHRKFAGLYPWMHRRSDLTIVTNSVLRRIVERNGGRALELIDPLPPLDRGLRAAHDACGLATPVCITYICTYAEDEPYEDVFSAASLLGEDVTIHVTGNHVKHSHQFRVQPPRNVVLTGYLPDDEYHALLRRSDVVVDLTLLPDCLVCGGYEAASLGVPLVLSDTAVNREVFSPGVVYVQNDGESIAAGIREMLMEHGRYMEEARRLHGNLQERWQRQAQELRRWIA